MKRIVLSFFLVVAILSAFGQPTWTSIASGDWQNPAIWAKSGGVAGVSPKSVSGIQQQIFTGGHLIVTIHSSLELCDNDEVLTIREGKRLRLINALFRAFQSIPLFKKVFEYEIHQPNYAPTSETEVPLFGKWKDASRPQQGKYYVSANNLPWGINLYHSFDYPKEKREITYAYHKFVPWAISGGIQFPDWYLNLPGYRNEQLIYQKRE